VRGWRHKRNWPEAIFYAVAPPEGGTPNPNPSIKEGDALRTTQLTIAQG